MARTPGPWRTQRYGGRWAVERDASKCIADCGAFGGSLANARLIAAAPDMLEVLEVVLHQISADSDLDECVSAPEKYDLLEKLIRQVISNADPSNPQLHYGDIPESTP